MPEYYLRKGDPLLPVYEIDTEANTWCLAASAIGIIGEPKEMPDGGAIFRDTEKFERVWKKVEDGYVVTFTRDKPKHSPLPVTA